MMAKHFSTNKKNVDNFDFSSRSVNGDILTCLLKFVNTKIKDIYANGENSYDHT